MAMRWYQHSSQGGKWAPFENHRLPIVATTATAPASAGPPPATAPRRAANEAGRTSRRPTRTTSASTPAVASVPRRSATWEALTRRWSSAARGRFPLAAVLAVVALGCLDAVAEHDGGGED